jgi:hypothetical protein
MTNPAEHKTAGGGILTWERQGAPPDGTCAWTEACEPAAPGLPGPSNTLVVRCEQGRALFLTPSIRIDSEPLSPPTPPPNR